MPRRHVTRIATVALVGLVAVLRLASPASAASDAEKLPGLEAVLGELRQGGLVIYFRHALTDQATSSDDAADLAKCWTQRNLSDAGRAQAARIGTDFRRLGIPVGSVTTSPFCRCIETAQQAFGRHTVNGDLHFAIGAEAYDVKRFTQSLRTMLSTAPASGTNAVIVSHTANLREAAGIWPKPEGVAYVFRPAPGGGFKPLARVLPEDWTQAATPAGPGKPR